MAITGHPIPSSEQVQLYDRADGVKGHFCIGFKDEAGINWFWNERARRWCSAGTVYKVTVRGCGGRTDHGSEG